MGALYHNSRLCQAADKNVFVGAFCRFFRLGFALCYYCKRTYTNFTQKETANIRFNFRSLFGSNSTSSNKNKTKRQRGRTCRIEQLEEREMLSVTVGDFAAIKSQYADLNLTNHADYNIIEITANQLSSDAALRAALAEAGTTKQDDLIVVRTTSESNVIVLNGTELAVNTYVDQWGSITIVGFGTNPLALDANNQSRVLNVAYGTELALGGLILTKGRTATSDTTGGGGIYNAGNLTITESTITKNTVTANTKGGGGIFNDTYAAMTLTRSAVSDNVVDCSKWVSNDTCGGGGIYNATDAALTITNSAISGNTASSSYSYGGGIYNTGAGFTITNSMILGNTASSSSSYYSDSSGGGIFNIGADLTITNSTISGNSASSSSSSSYYSYGGGIYNTGADLTITNSTISGNSASSSYYYSYGGGIYGASNNLTVNNSIVAHNKASSDADLIRNSGAITGSNNLIGTSTGGTSLVNGVKGNIVGTSSVPIDPLFVSFTPFTTWSSELWKNWDLRLLATSPAIDAGDDALATDAEGKPLCLVSTSVNGLLSVSVTVTLRTKFCKNKHGSG